MQNTAPFDLATCMYDTGIDPFTKQEVYIAHNLRGRKMQRALLQFFQSEKNIEVRKALFDAGRADAKARPPSGPQLAAAAVQAGTEGVTKSWTRSASRCL